MEARRRIPGNTVNFFRSLMFLYLTAFLAGCGGLLQLVCAHEPVLPTPCTHTLQFQPRIARQGFTRNISIHIIDALSGTASQVRLPHQITVGVFTALALANDSRLSGMFPHTNVSICVLDTRASNEVLLQIGYDIRTAARKPDVILGPSFSDPSILLRRILTTDTEVVQFAHLSSASQLGVGFPRVFRTTLSMRLFAHFATSFCVQHGFIALSIVSDDTSFAYQATEIVQALALASNISIVTSIVLPAGDSVHSMKTKLQPVVSTQCRLVVAFVGPISTVNFAQASFEMGLTAPDRVFICNQASIMSDFPLASQRHARGWLSIRLSLPVSESSPLVETVHALRGQLPCREIYASACNSTSAVQSGSLPTNFVIGFADAYNALVALNDTVANNVQPRDNVSVVEHYLRSQDFSNILTPHSFDANGDIVTASNEIVEVQSFPFLKIIGTFSAISFNMSFSQPVSYAQDTDAAPFAFFFDTCPLLTQYRLMHSGVCVHCPTGFYNPPNDLREECGPCPVGQALQRNRCRACPTGHVITTLPSGASACVPTSAGFPIGLFLLAVFGVTLVLGVMGVVIGWRRFNASAFASIRSQERKRHFITSVFREIRAPLHHVADALQSIDDHMRHFDWHTAPTADIVATLDRFFDHVQHARLLLDRTMETLTNVLDLAKLQRGELDLAWEAVHLHALCRTVVQAVTAANPSVPVGFTMEYVPDARDQDSPRSHMALHAMTVTGIRIVGDPRRLKQILLNLLMCSVEHTSRGYVFFHVRVVQIMQVRRRPRTTARERSFSAPQSSNDSFTGTRPSLIPVRVHFEVVDTGIPMDIGRVNRSLATPPMDNEDKHMTSTRHISFFLSQQFASLMGSWIHVDAPFSADCETISLIDESLAAAPPVSRHPLVSDNPSSPSVWSESHRIQGSPHTHHEVVDESHSLKVPAVPTPTPLPIQTFCEEHANSFATTTPPPPLAATPTRRKTKTTRTTRTSTPDTPTVTLTDGKGHSGGLRFLDKGQGGNRFYFSFDTEMLNRRVRGLVSNNSRSEPSVVYSLQGVSVLVIDGFAPSRRLLADRFLHGPFELLSLLVTEAATLEQAMDHICRGEHFDIIFLGCAQGGHGRSSGASIRQLPQLPSSTIIVACYPPHMGSQHSSAFLVPDEDSELCYSASHTFASHNSEGDRAVFDLELSQPLPEDEELHNLLLTAYRRRQEI